MKGFNLSDKDSSKMIDLSMFFVSDSHGFLLKSPLTSLPDPFCQWVELATDLPSLVINHQLRSRVEKLPLLDHTCLKSHRELRLARASLTFITSGYVWQEGESGVSKTIPACLAVPLCRISERLGLKPVISHVDCVLSNWCKIDPHGPLELSNLETIFNLPGGQSSKMFFLLTAKIELDSVPGLKAIATALVNVDKGNVCGLIEDLNTLTLSIRAMQHTLSQFHDKVDCHVFYNKVRPFLNGYSGPALPDGIIFEGISDKPIKINGGSAAQSSPIQCFDEALGIQHDSSRKEFLVLMRDHMPPAHKAFIETISKGPSIRKFVECQKDDNLSTAYNEAVVALTEFRSYHVRIVARFIVIMSSEARRKAGFDYDGLAKQGTGGQTLMPFLKSIRDTTSKHCLNSPEDSNKEPTL